MATQFDACFAFTVGEEGGYQNARDDPGNWTGGAVGSGALRGTNWGISAASYPGRIIFALTEADAKAIYLKDYYLPAGCDGLPPWAALAQFDAAVQHGINRAVRWMQAAGGVDADGVIGPLTLAAFERVTLDQVYIALRVRLVDLTRSNLWPEDREGFIKRIFDLIAAVTETHSSAAGHP